MKRNEKKNLRKLFLKSIPYLCFWSILLVFSLDCWLENSDSEKYLEIGITSYKETVLYVFAFFIFLHILAEILIFLWKFMKDGVKNLFYLFFLPVKLLFYSVGYLFVLIKDIKNKNRKNIEE